MLPACESLNFRRPAHDEAPRMSGDPPRAFWVVEPGRGEIRDEAPLPAQPDMEHVQVRSRFGGISRGTETLVFRGEVPASQYALMRAPFQAGEFPGPVKYGYASVGVVEAGPAQLCGATVFCLHPHQTRYQVPARAVHRLPDGVPARRGILAANMETAVNALWDGAPRLGDRIVVVGAGSVGCLVAWLASRIPGCEVQLVDTDPTRAAVAGTLGIAFAAPEGCSADADLVYHASGNDAGLATALSAAGFEARVVELSWFGTRAVRAPLGETFHSARLSLVSSQVGHVAAARRARRDTRQRMDLALSLLAEPVLDALISGQSDFDELPALMPRLAAGELAPLCHCVAYP
jgi:threonine dehydrogenase-like Zn-dependent dehydrogenase